MAELHEVKAGESLANIAERYGFRSWRAVYDHPANAKLREGRPEPSLLPPGAKVYIPDKLEAPIEPAATDAAHTFKVKLAKTEGQVFLRSVTILVHGVNTTNPAWFGLIEAEIARHQDVIWVDEGVEHKLRYGIVPFSWGDYRSGKQGGVGQYAVDEVRQMFTKGFVSHDRIYQGHAAVRLKELLDEIAGLGVQINAICHSNGTAVLSGALLLGASVDNVIFMGSPLDCDNDRSQTEIRRATAHVRGSTTNFWSAGDEWAWIKGGIGAFGSNDVYRARNPQIVNVKFYRNAVIEGVRITEPEVDHSDYMLARHMPIFSAYVERWADACGPGGQVVFDQAKIDELRELGDWTNVSYYKERKNVTLESPEMQTYAAEIRSILE